MKKYKITGAVTAFIALVLEIIPYGVKMHWGDIYVERNTFHSYFDMLVWGYGDTAPFFTGLLTLAIFVLFAVSIFIKEHKVYRISLCLLSFTAVILSIVPSMFNSYTLIGGIITVALSISAEMTLLMLTK
ncbi:MAG: hypothetical protein J6B29_01955 [Clostridia bacterium]|nr:hypothetical protein [Clostridia bacterium]